MKKHLYLSLKIGVFCLFLSLTLNGQDIHYSNFSYSPLNLNPALTGVFNGDARFNGSFRSQWSSVPVSYVTFSGAFDTKLGEILRNKNRPWSIGALFNYDVAGLSSLSNINFNLSGSYGIPLGKEHRLTLGLMGGFVQRRFSTSRLTFDDQYFNKQFNPTSSSRDIGVFDRTQNFLDFSTGINYHYQRAKKRSALDIGWGLYHLNRPNTSFKDQSVEKLDARNSLYLSTNIQATKHFDVLFDAFGQWQGPHREFLTGVGGRFYLVDKRTKLLALQGGVLLRGADAYSPWVGLLYNRWKVALNFDANYSPFKQASDKLGGPELSIIYIFAKVPPGNYCPICPTFL